MDTVTDPSRSEPKLAPVPPDAPLAMPTQSFAGKPWRPTRTRRVHAARILTFGGAALLTVFGTWHMTQVFETAELSTLQWLFRALFAVTFAWIALAATSALAGILLPPRTVPAERRPLSTRTAIVMPIYQEDAAKSAGTLAALGRGLIASGHGDAFEIFILSDSRDVDAWSRETTAFAGLRQALGGEMRAWYRRRRENRGRKAGNVQDFVERWGARYDFMLVLDADSAMSPETVVEMARRMEQDPKLGLLQTLPVLIGGTTPFARLQQFAGRLYGPVVARGVAAWQGEDGNYWGHNAIIRVHAFASSCGLPTLPGRRPFGGNIMSHDFVEAAFLRRAGWAVRLDPDLAGSFEGAPPSLLDASVRDRRWAQGNFQHLAVLGARRLAWPNRVHFLIGVGSYLASPLWLALLTVGLVLTVRANLTLPEYFPDGVQLFPTWPQFDVVRMRWVFAGTMLLLFLPKLIGLAAALVDRVRRRRFGGGPRIMTGAVFEVVLSTLLAPIMMLLQTRHVVSILAGRDSGWMAQQREGQRLRWGDALRAHGTHAAVGIGLTLGVALLQPALVFWLSPVLVGLALAPLLSRWSGDLRAGAKLAALRLLDIPEDREVPETARDAERLGHAFERVAARDMDTLAAKADLVSAHVATLEPTPTGGVDERLSLNRLTASAKIAAASARSQALGWLTLPEREAVLGDASLLTALVSMPASSPSTAAAATELGGARTAEP